VNPVVAPGVAFASFPCGWTAGDAATQVLRTGWGARAAPWHSVLLKQSGVAPGAGAGGGETGEFAPFKWQKAHTDAFPVAVVVWI